MNIIRRLTVFGLAFFGMLSILQASISYSPLSPKVNEPVNFFLTPSHTNLVAAQGITWSFGDGSGITTPTSQLTVNHTYTGAGTYTVSATYYYSPPSGAPTAVTERTNVTVIPAVVRSLSFSPAQPNTCETVTFQATGFVNSTARWDFGDSTVVASGPLVETHAYLSPGSYVVHAYDGGLGASSPSASATVPVVNERSLSVSPPQPKTGVSVTFQAQGFVTPCIQWDFGDGTVLTNGAVVANHTYLNPGAFQVTATDNCGSMSCNAMVSVSVIASQGPLAPFTVSYGLLHFANGLTDISVAKDTTGLTAFADLKYEGTGLLQVEWRVDGQAVKTDALSLGFADRTTINSGSIPGLPTTIPGTHTVSLVILNPAVEFVIPSITYFIGAAGPGVVQVAVVPHGENTAAPLVQLIAPKSVERGQEYNLKLEGLRFTDSTVVTLAGIGVKSFNRASATLAFLDVFVPPTAKEGDRLAIASNEQGTNIGPAVLTVAKPQPPLVLPQNPCVDVSKIEPESIIDLSPSWWSWQGFNIHVGQAGSSGPTPVPSGNPPTLNIPVIDDFTVLRWKLWNPTLDYLEVRFFSAKTNDPIMTKTLLGGAQSLHLTGDLIFELFSHIPENQMPVNMAKYIPLKHGVYSSFQNYYYLNPGASAEQVASMLWSQGCQKADVIWQVVGFRKYFCAYDSTQKTSPQSNVALQVAESDLALFKLPDRPKGLACGPSGLQKAQVKVNLFNETKNNRKQGTVLANADLIGDEWVLQGSLALTNSPYGENKEYSTAVTVPNLFLDWGDGTGAVPLSGKIKGQGTTWDKSVEIEIPKETFTHAYEYTGAYTVRIFQLSDYDIQQPTDSFYETLSQAITPSSPSGNDPYYSVAPHGPSQSGSSGTPPMQAWKPGSGGDPLAGVLSRAYLVYCNNLSINPYQDTCALGSLNLVSLEILDFPGHDILQPGSSTQTGIHINTALIKAMPGIDAVAVTCDTALFAHAQLTYFGAGDAEILWWVDDQLVYTDTSSLRGLASSPRQNLGQGQSLNCTSAIHSKFPVDSGMLPVDKLGKHTVRAEVRVSHSFALSNLGLVFQSAVKSLAKGGAAGTPPAPGPEPSGAGPKADSPPPDPAVGTLDPWLSALSEQQKSGNPAPQIGFLNPNLNGGGQPPVAYVNDLFADPNLSFGNAAGGISSSIKTYLVNEVRDKLGCNVVFPSQGGDFHLTDMAGGSTSLSQITLDPDNTYSGSGTLHIFIRDGSGAKVEKFVPGTGFKGWSIDEQAARVTNGKLDVSPSQQSQISFSGAWGTLAHIAGSVANNVSGPMLATFDITLKSKYLHQLIGDQSVPVKFTGVAAPITVQGDWYAAGLQLGKTQIGLSNFSIQSDDVTLDFSEAQSPSSAKISSPGWVGLYLGQAQISPYIPLNLTPTNSFKVTNKEDWIVQDGGLSGRAVSSPFDSDIQEGHFHFADVDFIVTGDVPEATYHDVQVKVPWIGVTLHGDAQLVKINDQVGYGTDMAYITAPPVTQSYPCLGKITMTAQNFLLTTDPTGPVVQCDISPFAFETEGKPFASFSVNGFLFGFDGRAHFPGPAMSLVLPLDAKTTFGQSGAQLTSVTLDASAPGDERLHFTIATVLSLSDSDYIPSSNVAINYALLRSGSDYSGQGPWNTPYQMGVVFPLGSQEMQSQVSPSYIQSQQSSLPEPEALPGGPRALGGADSGGASGDGNRYSGSVDFTILGGKGITAQFVLGYKNGKSYYLILANVATKIPLSPIPMAIYSFGGGFVRQLLRRRLDGYGAPDHAESLPAHRGLQRRARGRSVRRLRAILRMHRR